MLLRVLGPLEVAGADGPVALGGAKPRALLAALAIGHGAICTNDALIDALWGESPPPSAGKLLQLYVSQLRRVLPAGLQIVTRAAGYVLEADPASIDAEEFCRLVADGRAARRAANPALAASILARALALWRGPAYADVRYEPFAEEETERLERLRGQAVIERIEADLEVGRHAEVLPELRGLLATDATQERTAALAMLAAYRTAAAEEALELFAMVGDALRLELDEEPGEELVALRDRIVARDPALDLPATLEARALHPLQIPSTVLVGRRRELSELRTLLARPGVRLVSLTGAGGSGKSRLALELAHELAGTYANGAVLVELAPLRAVELVPAAIARELGLELGLDAVETLVDALSGREMLLILDNVEHLRGAAPLFVRLLAGAPRLTILVTTRVVLHVSGEHVYPVPPLPEDDAVALFADRARASEPSFSVDAANRSTVAGICHRLDGLPLAIELAAARVRVLGLQGLHRRLASRLTVLTGGPRDLPARQQTLRETLDWSVSLLERRYADVLATLSVFAGSWPPEAAMAVAEADDETVAELVDHSLVQALDVAGERRFRLLETVREYAHERLVDIGRLDDARTSHAIYFLDLAEAVHDLVEGRGPMTPLRDLSAEDANLTSAVHHLSSLADGAELELRLCAALWRYWWLHGRIADGRAWLARALGRGPAEPTAARAEATRGASYLALRQGDVAAAVRLGAEALAAASGLGDVARARAEVCLANALGSADEIDPAAELYARATTVFRDTGQTWDLGIALLNTADNAIVRGDLDLAERVATESLAIFRAIDDDAGIAVDLANLAFIALERGDAERARDLLREALELSNRSGFLEWVAIMLDGLGAVAAALGSDAHAARLLGAAGRLRDEIGASLDSIERRIHDRAMATVQARVGADALQAEFEAGRSIPTQEAIGLALRGPGTDTGAVAGSAHGSTHPAGSTRTRTAH